MPVTSMRGCCASARAAAIRLARGARPLWSLSGLPGVTSHQTRSRPSCFMAIRQAARWAACGGSKLPPNRPMRMPRACGGRCTRPAASRALSGPIGAASEAVWQLCINAVARRSKNGSRPDLPGAVHAVFEAGELLHTDRSTRMEATGGDPDLSPEPELAAVGELGRGIVQDDRRIDFAQEFLGGCLIGGNDRICMMGAVALDMR